MHATQVKDAAKRLAEMGALRIDRDDVLSPTELGRVVSHYYISVSLTLYMCVYDVSSPTELGRVVSHYYISVSLTLYI